MHRFHIRPLFFEKVLEQCAVMNDRLPQVFRIHAIRVSPSGDRAGGAIVLDDDRMIHRNISDALIEVGHRITPGAHYFVYQVIGFGDGPFRVIDEQRLHMAPHLSVPRHLGGRKRPDVQLLDSLFTRGQYGFRAPHITNFRAGSLVFGPEPLTQSQTSLP